MSSTPSVPDTSADDHIPATAPESLSPTPDNAAPSDTAKEDAQASYARTAAALAERFPALFSKEQAKPLKLRIQVDIQERAPDVFTKQALSAFFRRYTHTTAYLNAVSQATERFDLDGQPAGELSEEHRNLATEELARRRAIVKARREEAFQAQREAQREARKQERAAHQQDREVQHERRARAQLLRDFDTTRLTTANFCALKGIDPAQLETVLAQAREEAKQDALRPRPEGRRDHRGGPRTDGAPREGRGPRRDGGRPAGTGNHPPRKPQA